MDPELLPRVKRLHLLERPVVDLGTFLRALARGLRHAEDLRAVRVPEAKDNYSE